MSRKPNVVLVAADGVGWGDVSYGNPVETIPTPHIDSWSNKGVRFNRYYAQSTSTASRASLLTGRYASNAGLTWDLPPSSPAGLPESVATLPGVLSSLNYSTRMAGVWDLGHSQWKLTPTGRGFDEFAGSFMKGADAHSKTYYDAPWHDLGKDWIHVYASNDQHAHVTPLETTNDATTSEALRMMQAHARLNDGRPLFLYVSYSTASALSVEKAQCENIKHLWRRQHCAAMAQIDDGIGSLAAKAQELLGEDTVFIFTSANGASPLSGGLNTPYRGGEGSVLEGGVRVPAFAVDFSPDARYFGGGGWAYNGLTHISDWFPTIAAAAKGSVTSYKNSGGDGFDMSVTLKYYRDRKPHREFALLELHESRDPAHDHDSVAAVSGDLKYIEGTIRDGGLYIEPAADRLNMVSASWSSFFGEKFLRAIELSIGSTRFRPLKRILAPKILNNAANGAFLYNLTADPQEQENLVFSQSDLVPVMQEKVKMYKRLRRLSVRQLSLQYDAAVIGSTLASGECGSNTPGDSHRQCMFAHPWVRDTDDPYSAALVSSHVRGDAIVMQASVGFAAVMIAVTVATVIALWKMIKRKPPPPLPKIIEKPKQ